MPSKDVVKKIARTFVELLVAALFLTFAAETFAHRHGTSQPRIQTVYVVFAGLVAFLGLLPLTVHYFPRFGRSAFLVWLISAALALGIGFVTGP